MTPRVRRPVVVLAAVVLFGALFAAATRTWVRTGLASPVGGATTLELAGSQAAPAATACALAGLAASAAMSIAGRRTVRLVVGVCALAAAGAAWGAAAVLREPAVAVRAQVAEALAVTPDSVDAGTADVTTTAWVWVALVLSAAALLTAVVGLLAAGTWRERARFDVPPAPSGRLARASGDASAGSRPSAEPAPGKPADDAGSADTAASWDALTRGVDPTRAATPARTATPPGGTGPVDGDSDAAGGRMDPPGHTDGGTTHA